MGKKLFALVGDVWYQILGIEGDENKTLYKLYSLDYLVPHNWIKEIKEMD
jgi:hypothetical protein